MKTIDELIYDWEQALINREYGEADRIRDYLDSKHVFCFMAVDGPLIYHRTAGTRDDMKAEIRRDIAANNTFDGWLTTVRNSNDYKRLNS